MSPVLYSAKVGALSSSKIHSADGKRSRYLPKDIGQMYYGNKSAFTFLRDPPLGSGSGHSSSSPLMDALLDFFGFCFIFVRLGKRLGISWHPNWGTTGPWTTSGRRFMAWIPFSPSAAGKTPLGGKIIWIEKARSTRPGPPSWLNCWLFLCQTRFTMLNFGAFRLSCHRLVFFGAGTERVMWTPTCVQSFQRPKKRMKRWRDLRGKHGKTTGNQIKKAIESTWSWPCTSIQTFLKVLAGDVYRADCHFLPQATLSACFFTVVVSFPCGTEAEYFENPFAEPWVC